MTLDFPRTVWFSEGNFNILAKIQRLSFMRFLYNTEMGRYLFGWSDFSTEHPSKEA